MPCGKRGLHKSARVALKSNALMAPRQFMAEQVRKTLRDPARAIYIPFNLSRLLLGRALYLGRGIIPSRAVYRRVRHLMRLFTLEERINRAFDTADQLLQQERPREAWVFYDRCLRESRDPRHYFVAAVCLLQGLGRFRHALSLLAQANELRLREAEKLGVAPDDYRVLDAFWSGHIGHTATLDYVIKLGILEGKARDDIILYVPPGSPVANPFLLRQLAQHAKYIDSPVALPFREEALRALQYDYMGPLAEGGMTLFFWALAGKTYRRWHADRRGPLLTLPRETEERGWQALETKGVPHGAWFVGLHVREAGSKWHHNSLHQVLNADIATYLPAIAEITQRGGWVIRMGDKSMIPLPPMPNVVDYCHSALHSDWMDVFVAAKCRFFLGTSSGPAYVPPLYGTPSVLTNWWPPAQRPWHPTDIFVPKMLRRLADGRFLTLRETLAEPFSFCHSLKYLEKEMKVSVEDNDESMIRESVVEMIERLEANTTHDADDCKLRQEADRIYDEAGAFGMGRLARVLLQRYASFVS